MTSTAASVITAMLACLLLVVPPLHQLQAADGASLSPSALPAGVIVMWSGSLDSIPAGWALCDGSNGTPDLSNRFVLGAGNEDYLGSTGGSRTHRHRIPEHSHQVDPPSLRLSPGHGGTGGYSRIYTIREQSLDIRPFTSGTAKTAPDEVSHLPPYYKIAFIMKL